MARMCLSVDCRCEAPGDYIFCPAHWRLVPQALKEELLQHIRAAKAETEALQQSLEFLDALNRAQNAIAQRDGK